MFLVSLPSLVPMTSSNLIDERWPGYGYLVAGKLFVEENKFRVVWERLASGDPM
jgi:hypothetical protein